MTITYEKTDKFDIPFIVYKIRLKLPWAQLLFLERSGDAPGDLDIECHAGRDGIITCVKCPSLKDESKVHASLIHELLHYKYPDLENEEEIWKLTEKTYREWRPTLSEYLSEETPHTFEGAQMIKITGLDEMKRELEEKMEKLKKDLK